MKLFNYFYRNPLTTYNKVKGIFVSLKRNIWFGLIKNTPLFYTGYVQGKLLDIYGSDVLWKDKYDTPRFEEVPFIKITLFSKFVFLIYWTVKEGQNDEYWEQVLWYLYYNNTVSQGLIKVPDLETAKESWPWTDMRTNKTTWKNEYLL